MKDDPERHYYSISDVSQTTKVKAHVLRYWESQFSMLRPRKSRGGIRMYRSKDLSLIDEIKHLLYDRGYTIAGARRKLLEDRRARGEETDQERRGPSRGDGPAPSRGTGGKRGQREFKLRESRRPASGTLEEIKEEMKELQGMLKQRPNSRKGRQDSRLISR